MTDNGLAALAAALGEYKAGIIGTFSIPQSAAPRWDDRSIEDREAWITGATDDAAAILGPRGVFLPDGVCNHIGLINALKDNAATIATLRAALDGLVEAAAETVAAWDEPENYRLRIWPRVEAALRAALATAKEAGR